MKLSTSYLFALTTVNDAKKTDKKNKENYHHVIVSGKERAFGEHCLAEQNEDGILTMTTTIGLNEVASCHRQLGCRDGYTLARKIVSIDGLQDCAGCQDDDGWQATGPQPSSGWHCNSNYDHNSFKFKYSKDGNDVTETYCSEKEYKNPDVNIGSWVNTNAQVLDFTFQLEVPINEDNAMYIAGLYFDYADYDPTYDYETYMTEMDELSKYEVLFKCVKEPTPEPVSDNPIKIEEKNGITTVSMVDNSDTAVGFSRNLSCESGRVQRKIVSISGFGEEYCEMIGNYAQFVYSIYRDDFMDYYHVDDKFCREKDGGDEYWRSMDNYVTFNFGFSPLTQNNYYYYYSNYDDWLQTAGIEIHLKCSDGSKLSGIEPTPTPTPSTVEPETTNTFYVNGLDQVVDDWKNMLADAAHGWWKDQKKERLQERFSKLVEVIRKHHNKMIGKGCTFKKINQSAGASEHFVNHGKMCESMGSYIKDLTNWGKDFVADCSGASKGLTERNHAWWKKYSDKIQKFKLRMEKEANCYDETPCGCYAKDEEISIEEDKCVLNLGTFPDTEGWWKFTYELKINSLPKDGDFDPEANLHWSFDFLSIAMDGYDSYDVPDYPNHLVYFIYKKLSWAGQSINIGIARSSLLQPNIVFEEGEWYKFTITGKPIGSDGELMFYDWRNPDKKPTECRYEYLIEGPGLKGGKWTITTHSHCMEKERKTITGQEGHPLKVFAAKKVGLGDIMDGVVRNIVFENEATDTVVDTTC